MWCLKSEDITRFLHLHLISPDFKILLTLPPCLSPSSLPLSPTLLQMVTCTQVSTLTSWAQTPLCLGPWEAEQRSERSSTTPGGSTVSKCGCEEVNAADYRLWFLSSSFFSFLFLFDNHLPQSPLYLSVVIPAEPVFVQIQQIPDSAEKNDDKLYFFFREKSLDSSGGASPSVLARVGRVCLVRRASSRMQRKTHSAHLCAICNTLCVLSRDPISFPV